MASSCVILNRHNEKKTYSGQSSILSVHERLVRTDIRLMFERWDQVPLGHASGWAESDEQACRCNDPHHSEAAFVATVSRFKNVV